MISNESGGASRRGDNVKSTKSVSPATTMTATSEERPTHIPHSRVRSSQPPFRISHSAAIAAAAAFSPVTAAAEAVTEEQFEVFAPSVFCVSRFFLRVLAL